MEDHILEALGIVTAQAGVREMDATEIISMLQTVSSSIKLIIQQKDAPCQQPLIPEKAIKENSIVCLECGQSFRLLTKKHLAGHGLTPSEYKSRWGYKPSVSLACKRLVRRRRELMVNLRLWERKILKKAPSPNVIIRRRKTA